jgi:hypothetical protein
MSPNPLSFPQPKMTTPTTMARRIVDAWKKCPVGPEENEETLNEIREVLRSGDARGVLECVWESATAEGLPIVLTDDECKGILTLVLWWSTDEE